MRVLLASLAVAVCLVSSTAAADASSDADRLFQEGKRLVESGNYVAACTRFEASLALEPGIGARLWLAECYETLGRTATAQAQFRIAAAEAHRAGDRREQVAQGRADALERRVAHIVVNVENAAAGERVEVDGAALAAPGEKVPVDPGRHLVTATAPGFRPWQLSFDAASPPNPISVVVPELVALSPHVVPAAETLPPPVHARWQTSAGIASAGAGAAGVVIGGVLAVLAIEDNDHSKDGCSETCTGNAHAQRLSAKEEANGATAAFITGGALLAVGATLLFLVPRSRRVAHVTQAGLLLTF